MPDEQLTVKQAMELRVADARRALNDGALVQETLEWLWRVAYSAGVRTGQAPIADRNLSEQALKIELAAQEGWKWGSPWVTFPKLAVGSRFTYGGVDRQGPVCERSVIALQHKGRLRMQLDDTGERAGIPAICWHKPIPEPRPEEPEDG